MSQLSLKFPLGTQDSSIYFDWLELSNLVANGVGEFSLHSRWPPNQLKT